MAPPMPPMTPAALLTAVIIAMYAAATAASAAGSIAVTVDQASLYAAEWSSPQLRCNFSAATAYVMWYYASYLGASDRAKLAMCHQESGRCLLSADGLLAAANWTNALPSVNGSLTLQAVARQQDGYYECEGMTEAMEVARAGVRLFVVVSGSTPEVSQSPDTLSHGDSVTLTCSTTGWNPPVNLTWSRTRRGQSAAAADAALTTASDPAATAKFGPASSALTLTVSAADDESVVACSARQLAIGQVSTGQLKIRVQFKPSVTPILDIAAKEGFAVSVTCHASGYPVPAMQLVLADNGTVLQEAPATVASAAETPVADSASKIFTAVFSLADIHRSQSGRYGCRATNSLGAAVANFRLDVQFPPNAQAPSAVTVAQGRPTRLDCRVTGNPLPASAEWHHVPSGQIHRTNTSSSSASTAGPDAVAEFELRIEAADRAQSGEWRCVVRALLASATQFTASASVLLTVQYPPGQPVVAQPPDSAVVSGLPLSLGCTPNANSPGEPPPSLRWSRPANAGYYDGPSLAIGRLSLADSGVYFCHASNGLGASQSESISLLVRQSPRAAGTPAGPIRARQGNESFSLRCDVTAHPRPLIRWLVGGASRILVTGGDGASATAGERFSAQYEISSEPFRYSSFLHFRGTGRSSVELNDTGSFVCEAFNELGAVQLTFQLVVEVPPIITNQLTKVAQLATTTNGTTSANAIICQFVSHRPYNVSWTSPDGAVTTVAVASSKEDDSHNSTADNQPPWQLTSSLPSPAVAKEPLTLGNYSCRVTNSLGSASLTFALVPKSPPDPPLRAACRPTGWDRFQLAWTPGFDGGYPTRLRVSVTGWNASLGRDAPAADALEVDASAGELEVAGLYPDTVYSVQLTPANRLGPGRPYGTLVATTGHLRLPQVTSPQWDPRQGVLTFRAGGVNAELDCCSCYCARVQESRDGGDVWLTVGGCGRLCFESGGGGGGGESLSRVALADPAACLYRVSICLAGRPDVCGLPYTTYSVASQASISTGTIILVTCVCAGVVVSLAVALTCLCVRRHAGSARRSKEKNYGDRQQLSQDQLRTASSAAAAAAAPVLSSSSASASAAAAATSASVQHPNSRLIRHQTASAMAFVSPALTDRSSNQTQETCLDGSSCSPIPQPHQSEGSSASAVAASLRHQLGGQHQLGFTAIYDSDVATEGSGSGGNCFYSGYSPQSRRKVIYEVVV